MKKFLFTLAALLMATSAYAAEKFWVDAEPFLNATPGVEFTVPVHAQFDGMVSAWTMDLGTIVDGEFVENVLPAGIAVTYFEKGVDMKITFKNSRGRDATVEASLGSSQNDTRFISATSTSDQEYYQVDGAWVAAGVVKWLPNTYDEMVLLYFETTEEYDGTPIAIRCQPTCGNDARDIPRSDGTVTVTPWYSDQPVPADKPVITVTNDNTTAVSFTIAGEEGATIYYKYGNMTEYAVYTGEVTETVEGTYTVEAYAVGPNGKTESEHETANFTVAAPAPVPADKPVINVINNNTTDVTVEITAEEGATIMYQVTENGAKAYAAYNGPMHFTTPGNYTIEAYAEGPNGKTESEHETANFTVKAPDQPSTPGNVDIVVNPTTYEVTPTGNEAQIIVDGEVVNAPLVIERPAYGQDDINVTVTVRTDDGEGFYPVETPVTFVVKAQLPQPNIVATPGQASEDYDPEAHTHNNQVDGHFYNVTFDAPAGSTVHYIINGPNGAHFEGNWVAGDDPIHVTVDGTYSVEAYTVDGEDRSTSDFDTFVISPKTGVNELMNGKTVASQRFFNLAGQEMTEANGVTIVVTTYTDGTTSAVKVMK